MLAATHLPAPPELAATIIWRALIAEAGCAVPSSVTKRRDMRVEGLGAGVGVRAGTRAHVPAARMRTRTHAPCGRAHVLRRCSMRLQRGAVPQQTAVLSILQLN